MTRRRRTTSYDEVERAILLLTRRARSWGASLAGQVHPGLDRTGYALLTLLQERGPSRQTELAEHLSVDKSVVSREVATLELAGLVARVDDPADRRTCLLTTSEAGRERLRVAQEGRRQAVRRLLQGWDDDDVDDLARLLGRLTDDMPVH